MLEFYSAWLEKKVAKLVANQKVKRVGVGGIMSRVEVRVRVRAREEGCDAGGVQEGDRATADAARPR